MNHPERRAESVEDGGDDAEPQGGARGARLVEPGAEGGALEVLVHDKGPTVVHALVDDGQHRGVPDFTHRTEMREERVGQLRRRALQRAEKLHRHERLRNLLSCAFQTSPRPKSVRRSWSA